MNEEKPIKNKKESFQIIGIVDAKDYMSVRNKEFKVEDLRIYEIKSTMNAIIHNRRIELGLKLVSILETLQKPYFIEKEKEIEIIENYKSNLISVLDTFIEKTKEQNLIGENTAFKTVKKIIKNNVIREG